MDNLTDVSIYSRLAIGERICDGHRPARELSFNDLYKRWKDWKFFKQLAELGFVQVSYYGGAAIEFIPSADLANRHQALALSCFLATRYANSSAIISAPHERGGIFKATFKRVSPTCVEYVNEDGGKVQFTFDSTRPSQFISCAT